MLQLRTPGKYNWINHNSNAMHGLISIHNWSEAKVQILIPGGCALISIAFSNAVRMGLELPIYMYPNESTLLH